MYTLIKQGKSLLLYKEGKIGPILDLNTPPYYVKFDSEHQIVKVINAKASEPVFYTHASNVVFIDKTQTK